MKKILLFFAICSIASQSIFCQVTLKVLPVPKIGQQNTQWCWAASIEMVIKFLGKPSPSQKNLAFQLSTIQTPSCQNCSGFDTCSGEYTCTRYFNGSPLCCNIPIVDASHFVTLFDRLGYGSTLNRSILNWDSLKLQIDSTKPIIISIDKNLYSKVPSLRDSDLHIVVITGYAIINNQKFVFVNDPWRMCEGCQYAVDYESLKKSIRYSVINITDRTPTTTLPGTITCLEKYATLINSIPKDLKNLKDLNLNNVDPNDPLIFIPLVTIPLDFYEDKNYSQNISNMITQTQEVVVFRKSSPSETLILRYDTDTGLWIIIKVNVCSCTLLCCKNGTSTTTAEEQSCVYKIPKTTTTSSKKPKAILYHPYFELSFKYYEKDETGYIIPITDYIFDYNNSLFMNFKNANIYESSYMFKKLKYFTKKYIKNLKVLN